MSRLNSRAPEYYDGTFEYLKKVGVLGDIKINNEGSEH